MANDPAFLFYPGDYLRDTQCLSERSQVAYDRIMCEHMRNICISQSQLDFFTKRLTADEKNEIEMVLQKNQNGYCIPWVVDSIVKRREYSDSRRKNRSSSKKDMSIISKTYDSHMENEIENVNESVITIGIKNKFQISIKAKYTTERPIIIYDLKKYFEGTAQLEALILKKWDRFEDFMKENPANVFEDATHLYNSFRNFHTKTPIKNGKNTNSASNTTGGYAGKL